MKIISFNANGIRSAASKGFFDWFEQQNADFLCIQETKSQALQRTTELTERTGYKVWFRDASTKKGYSGVAIYSKHIPNKIYTELGWPEFDEEGRYIELEFNNLSVVSFYIPSGTSGDLRQNFKLETMEKLQPILERWRTSGRNYVLCGDWNIVRSALDIKNWKTNQNTPGCLPIERDWLNALCQPPQGWVDTYRHLHPTGEDYTWWSHRAGARDNNVGWRIDYQLTTPELRENIVSCEIFKDIKFSDHAPYIVTYSGNIL